MTKYHPINVPPLVNFECIAICTILGERKTIQLVQAHHVSKLLRQTTSKSLDSIQTFPSVARENSRLQALSAILWIRLRFV